MECSFFNTEVRYWSLQKAEHCHCKGSKDLFPKLRYFHPLWSCIYSPYGCIAFHWKAKCSCIKLEYPLPLQYLKHWTNQSIFILDFQRPCAWVSIDWYTLHFNHKLYLSKHHGNTPLPFFYPRECCLHPYTCYFKFDWHSPRSCRDQDVG